VQRKWARIHEEEENIRVLLKRSPYRAILEGALRRYCRALDSADLSRAFLELWALLETLTGISERDSHKSVVKRATFIWPASEHRTHEQVLHHLRRHRNFYAHSGEHSHQRGAYLHQLRLYVEQILRFHLINSRFLGSMDRAARFFDLPYASSDLQHYIKGREKDAKEASEAANLAREALRFRQSG
jgi:hypothetical protein